LAESSGGSLPLWLHDKINPKKNPLYIMYIIYKQIHLLIEL
jgi:hypothetical protein